jgi:hypothetical protein
VTAPTPPPLARNANTTAASAIQISVSRVSASTRSPGCRDCDAAWYAASATSHALDLRSGRIRSPLRAVAFLPWSNTPRPPCILRSTAAVCGLSSG